MLPDSCNAIRSRNCNAMEVKGAFAAGAAALVLSGTASIFATKEGGARGDRRVDNYIFSTN
jgi:hypothetical protein